MHPAIREKLASLRERHDELNGLLALPETAADPAHPADPQGDVARDERDDARAEEEREVERGRSPHGCVVARHRLPHGVRYPQGGIIGAPDLEGGLEEDEVERLARHGYRCERLGDPSCACDPPEEPDGPQYAQHPPDAVRGDRGRPRTEDGGQGGADAGGKKRGGDVDEDKGTHQLWKADRGREIEARDAHESYGPEVRAGRQRREDGGKPRWVAGCEEHLCPSPRRALPRGSRRQAAADQPGDGRDPLHRATGEPARGARPRDGRWVHQRVEGSAQGESERHDGDGRQREARGPGRGPGDGRLGL